MILLLLFCKPRRCPERVARNNDGVRSASVRDELVRSRYRQLRHERLQHQDGRRGVALALFPERRRGDVRPYFRLGHIVGDGHVVAVLQG